MKPHGAVDFQTCKNSKGISKMTDIFAANKRSEIMSKVKSKNTKPEMKVRSLLHKMGYRFRIHRADLPGTPDIVLPKYKVVIFVHGCFWHQHPGCKKATIPKNNSEFWRIKLGTNRARDLKNVEALENLGWHVMIIWECRIRNLTKLTDQIETSLRGETK